MFNVPPHFQETYKEILEVQKNDNPLLRLNLAAVSPVTEEGQIDGEAFHKLYSELSDRIGFSSLLLAGATGEGEFLDAIQFQQLYSAGLRLKQEKGTHLIGGVIRKSKKETLEAAKFWAGTDVDYIIVAMPTNEELTQADISRLLSEVTTLGKDVIVYRTGLSTTLPELETLTKSHIVAVKDTTGKEDSLYTRVGELYTTDKLLLQGNDRWFYESFGASLENGQDYIGNISGACNLAPFADLRNIIAASLIEEKRTGNEEYNVIAKNAQEVMNEGFDELFTNIDSVGKETEGGRREVPIVLSALGYLHNNIAIPERSLNPGLNEYSSELARNHKFLFEKICGERDYLLERYQQLKSI